MESLIAAAQEHMDISPEIYEAAESLGLDSKKVQELYNMFHYISDDPVPDKSTSSPVEIPSEFYITSWRTVPILMSLFVLGYVRFKKPWTWWKT